MVRVRGCVYGRQWGIWGKSGWDGMEWDGAGEMQGRAESVVEWGMDWE